MIRHRLVWATPFIVLLGWATATAQLSPTTSGAQVLRFPNPTITPPLNSGMPYDVMIGYIVGDSLARGMSLAKQDSLFRFLTYSDTLRYALKYLYQMTDHDPIAFFMWGSYQPTTKIYPSEPGVLRNRLIERARKLYPDSQGTAMLCASDIIAHIRVGTTQTTIDSTAAIAPSAVLVTSEMIEPIKGHRIPNCWIAPRAKREEKQTMAGALAAAEGDGPAASGACLQFEYRLEWKRLNHGMSTTNLDSSLVDSDGRQWVQPNTEYIVFLQLLGLGRAANYNVASLIPVAWFGTTCSMYPIINGKVYDPYDDFGFGANLTLEQFTSALRAKIATITNP